ncbi:uncharacterized protein CDAR_200081 [Caerostris darwini]|uniref:Uncharacterized protein n=1 Tax=Caerostris darwini TaxID=1538125 RepID=A0AAV4RLZ1_9ARAC|nr:uncharacterized protein CDAR_200081 [Caerostris darwini]
MHKLIRITKVTWGLNPEIKKEIYNRVIEKIITYGFEDSYNDTARQNINLCKLQRIGLLNITKCYKTVSTDALSIPPIHITLRNRIKIYQLRQDILIQDKTFKFLDVESKPTIDPPWNRYKINWKVFDKDIRGFSIYTDDSKLNNQTGWVLVVFIDGHEEEHLLCKLNAEATVFMA